MTERIPVLKIIEIIKEVFPKSLPAPRESLQDRRHRRLEPDQTGFLEDPGEGSPVVPIRKCQKVRVADHRSVSARRWQADFTNEFTILTPRSRPSGHVLPQFGQTLIEVVPANNLREPVVKRALTGGIPVSNETGEPEHSKEVRRVRGIWAPRSVVGAKTAEARAPWQLVKNPLNKCLRDGTCLGRFGAGDRCQLLRHRGDAIYRLGQQDWVADEQPLLDQLLIPVAVRPVAPMKIHVLPFGSRLFLDLSAQS